MVLFKYRRSGTRAGDPSRVQLPGPCLPDTHRLPLHPLRVLGHVPVRFLGGRGQHAGGVDSGCDPGDVVGNRRRGGAAVGQLDCFEGGAGVRRVLSQCAAAGAVVLLVLHHPGPASGAGGVRCRRGAVHQQRRHLHALPGHEQLHRRGVVGSAGRGGDCSGGGGAQGADAAGD